MQLTNKAPQRRPQRNSQRSEAVYPNRRFLKRFADIQKANTVKLSKDEAHDRNPLLQEES